MAELAAGTLEISGKHSKLLGPVAVVFWDSMYLISCCIRQPFYRVGGLTDWIERAKVSLLAHAFQLLLTSWDAALQGRFGAAANNVRSISEAPPYLLAIHFDHEFAGRWVELKAAPSVWEARSSAAKAMNKISAGVGTAWRTGQEKVHRKVQPFAHVNRTTALSSVGWEPTKVTVGAGGVVDREKLAALTGVLADGALRLLHVCLVAMPDMLTEPEDWEAKARNVLVGGSPLVDASAAELEVRATKLMGQLPGLGEESGQFRKGGS